MKRIRERALLIRPIAIPLTLYIVFTAAAVTQIDNIKDKSIQILLVVLPVVAALFIATGILNAINKLDELERKIILEAAAFSFLVTFFGLICLMLFGLIEIPLPDTGFIVLSMSLLLVAGKLYGNWRHK